MHRSMTLKQRITLGLAAFLLALAVQIFLSFYQSGTVMQRLDDQMGQFNAISRFQGGVERGLTVLGDYRWEYGDADALLSGLDSAFSTTDAWLWRIDGSLETVSEEEYLLYSAVCTTYKSYTALVEQLEAAVRTGDDAGAARLYYDQVLPCGSYLRQYTQQLLNTAISDAQGTYTEVSALSGRVKWAQTVVATVCLVLGCFMAWSVIRLLDPVQQMIGASRDIVAGKYDAPDVPIPGGGREIVQLTDAFNKMKHSMAQQMNTLQERNEMERELHRQKTEALELQNRMERSRMQQLRSQIDPHFLFNTLNVIQQTASTEKGYRTQALIMALSHLLRYSLMSNDEQVPLAREVRIVDEYYCASSKISVQILFRVSVSSVSPLESRLLALPEMEVSGVRRSWEIVRSRFARSSSFFACTVACSFSSAFLRFSMASAPSPRMESSTLFSKASSGFSDRSIPITPNTPPPVRSAR